MNMKKVNLSFRRGIVALSALFAAAVLFTACTKNKGDNVDVPSAGLMAFNLATDQQSVVVSLSGNLFTSTPLAYTSYTGIYRSIYTGDRDVKSYDYPASTPLASVNYTFEDDKYYSVFFVGRGGQYRNVITMDNFDSLSALSGKAYIRYVNGIADSVNAVNVTVGSMTKPAAYASVSEFMAVDPGDVNIAVSGAGADTSRSINVAAKNVYTVLLSGVPGATDQNKVQIKFVLNGTLTGEGK